MKRISSKRFVIYVNKGLYRENIEVGINANNIIMLVAGVLEGAIGKTSFSFFSQGRYVMGPFQFI